MRRSTVTTASIGAACLALVWPSAASAAVQHGYSVATQNGGWSLTGYSGGHGYAKGTIVFKSRTSFYVSMTYDDVCNAAGKGDGLGTYVWITIRSAGSRIGTRDYAIDGAGCAQGYKIKNATVTWYETVNAVQMSVHECNGHADGSYTCSTYAIDNDRGAWKDNEYVG